MGAVASSLGGNEREYVAMCCVNIVVAANAGGAFSPFGDLTTLMVWQKGKLGLDDFPKLLVPSLVNWLVPALMMNRRIVDAVPPRVDVGDVRLLPGAVEVMLLFVGTVVMTACFHSYAHLPPVLGMMTRLGPPQSVRMVEKQEQLSARERGGGARYRRPRMRTARGARWTTWRHAAWGRGGEGRGWRGGGFEVSRGTDVLLRRPAGHLQTPGTDRVGHARLLLRRHHVRGRPWRDGVPQRGVKLRVRELGTGRGQRRHRLLSSVIDNIPR